MAYLSAKTVNGQKNLGLFVSGTDACHKQAVTRCKGLLRIGRYIMIRITRFLLPVLVLVAAFCVNSASAQTVSFRNFTSFQDIVPGVDFFASNRETIAPYENAAKEAIERVKHLLGDDIPKGAIFICTNQTQTDSLYEPVVIRQGYSWVLISTTPEVQIRARIDSMRAQMGDNIPEDIMQRINTQLRDAASSIDQQAVSNMARNIAFAILQVITNDEIFQFRSSRVEDVGKSRLQDWLDIGIGAYVNGDKSAIRYLQENIDMMFPIDDVLFMPRPFVAPSTTGGGQGGMTVMTGGQMPKMSTGGNQGGGQGGQGGQRQQGQQGQGAPKSKPDGGGQQRTLPKDEQDRLLFDGQAISFFDYFLEKFGIEKMRELIEFGREGNESWDFVTRPDLLGRDFSKIETEWLEFLSKQSIPESKPKFKVQQ